MLLEYPDESFAAARSQLGAAIAALPDSGPARELASFWSWYESVDAVEAQKHYVETFDLRRKSSLYLTYYMHGDTRKRGMALLALKQRYRAAGYEPSETELPDYLPMALEFAARGGEGSGEAVLRVHRDGIELIHRALVQRRSPYASIVDAVRQVLGPIGAERAARVEDLALTGPPTETLGLAPYGPGWDSPSPINFDAPSER